MTMEMTYLYLVRVTGESLRKSRCWSLCFEKIPATDFFCEESDPFPVKQILK